MWLTALLSTALAAAPLWPSLSTPARVGGGGRDAALIVAIEDYAQVTDLPGAQQNALDWYAWLTDGRGTPSSRVTLLVDQAATREDILDAAKAAREAVQPGGTLWFVFIGRGGPGRSGQDGVLVGWDTPRDAGHLYGRGVYQTEVLGKLTGGAQARTVAVIDASFSGSVRDGVTLMDGLVPLAPTTATDTEDAIVLSAARSDQLAGMLPGGGGSGRPAFSYLALGALHGWADADRDGIVSPLEATRYTADALAALPMAHDQEPLLSSPTLGAPLSRGRQAGPDIASIRATLAPGTQPDAVDTADPDNTGAILARLSILQRNQDAINAQALAQEAALAPALASQRDAITHSAEAHWAQVKSTVDARALGRDQELAAYITTYADAAVSVADRSYFVKLPQVAEAQGLLRRMAAPEWVEDTDAARLLWQSCEADAGLACRRQLDRFIPTEQDAARKAAMLRRGCDSGTDWACAQLAVLHSVGRGVPVELDRARQLSAESCDAGVPMGCALQGDLLLIAPRDDEGAMAAHARACSLEPAFCLGEALLREQGVGTAADPELALPRYLKACDAGNGLACATLGRMIEEERAGLALDIPRAAEMYRRACDDRVARACLDLGRLHDEGLAEGPAAPYRGLACDLGAEDACIEEE